MAICLNEIQELVDQGEYAKALEQHIWYHHHILEEDPSQLGVRLSFALSYWKRLGEVYPPALEALIEIRDQKELLCRQNNFSDISIYDDVIAINEKLDSNSRSLSLFEKLEEVAPELAAESWNLIDEVAINEQRYDLIERYGYDIEEKFERQISQFNTKKSLYSDPEVGETVRRSSESFLVDQALRLISVALKIRDIETAKKIKAQTIELITLEPIAEKLKVLHIWDDESG